MTNTAAPLANDTRLVDALKRIGKLGETQGKAANTLPELAQEIAYIVHEQLVDLTQKDCPIQKIWRDNFAKKRDAAAIDGNTSKDTISSEKQQVSKLRSFAKAAEHLRQHNHDFQPVLRVARGRVNQVEDATGSTYERLCTVARAQVKQNTPMTDEEIDACLAPADDKAPKGELERLQKMVAEMDKMQKGTEKTPAMPSEQLESAMQWLKDRIATLEEQAARAKSSASRAALVRHSTLVPASPSAQAK